MSKEIKTLNILINEDFCPQIHKKVLEDFFSKQIKRANYKLKFSFAILSDKKSKKSLINFLDKLPKDNALLIVSSSLIPNFNFPRKISTYNKFFYAKEFKKIDFFYTDIPIKNFDLNYNDKNYFNTIKNSAWLNQVQNFIVINMSEQPWVSFSKYSKFWLTKINSLVKSKMVTLDMINNDIDHNLAAPSLIFQIQNIRNKNYFNQVDNLFIPSKISPSPHDLKLLLSNEQKLIKLYSRKKSIFVRLITPKTYTSRVKKIYKFFYSNLYQLYKQIRFLISGLRVSLHNKFKK
jgi:hypothetical protein